MLALVFLFNVLCTNYMSFVGANVMLDYIRNPFRIVLIVSGKWGKKQHKSPEYWCLQCWFRLIRKEKIAHSLRGSESAEHKRQLTSEIICTFMGWLSVFARCRIPLKKWITMCTDVRLKWIMILNKINVHHVRNLLETFKPFTFDISMQPSSYFYG